MISFEKFVEFAFLGLLSGLSAFAVRFLSSIAKTNSDLSAQIKVLRVDFGWHHDALKDHGVRIAKLETDRITKRSH